MTLNASMSSRTVHRRGYAAVDPVQPRKRPGRLRPAGSSGQLKRIEAVMQNENTPQAGPSEPLLSADEVAARAGVSVNTLARYRCEGKGPDYLYLPGGRVAYRAADVQAWMAESGSGDLIDTVAAAEIAGCSPKHLQNMRSYGTGPAYVRLKGQRGKTAVFYRPEDVVAWRKAR